MTVEKFQKFEERVRRSFQDVKKDNRGLKNKVVVLTEKITVLSPLSEQFAELQHQFTELVRQFSGGSLNRPVEERLTPQKHPPSKEHTSPATRKRSGDLTHLEQKGLVFIGRLQNEAGKGFIPVGMLTENLYPDKLNRKIKTTVSNILKKHVELGLIHRERMGNHWYAGLTEKGYHTIKKLLDENQLKHLTRLYEKR